MTYRIALAIFFGLFAAGGVAGGGLALGINTASWQQFLLFVGQPALVSALVGIFMGESFFPLGKRISLIASAFKGLVLTTFIFLLYTALVSAEHAWIQSSIFSEQRFWAFFGHVFAATVVVFLWTFWAVFLSAGSASGILLTLARRYCGFDKPYIETSPTPIQPAQTPRADE